MEADVQGAIAELRAQVEAQSTSLGTVRREAGERELTLNARIKQLESELQGIGFCSHNFDTAVGDIEIPVSQFRMLGASVLDGVAGAGAKLNKAKGVAIFHICQRCKAMFWSGKFAEGQEVEAQVSVADAKALFAEELQEAIRKELPALADRARAQDREERKALGSGNGDESHSRSRKSSSSKSSHR